MTDLTDEAVKALPDEIQVWRSTDTLDHIGAWSTTRYPPEAVTYVPKSDAQAAVALVVERAAEVCDDLAIGYAKHKGVPGALHDAARDIRALALDAGTAELAKLREQAEQADGMVKWLARRICNQRVRLRQMEGFKCRCCDLMAMRLQRLKRSNAYRADCDRLAAELAAAQQREARLRAALEYYADTFCEGFCKDLPQAGTYQPEMDLDCSGCKARAALAQTIDDPGDGWTWNERLGWIGPDGKPADPRRG